ncbi:MAG: hypothetical protein LBJ23_10690 [Tannerella sp.]|nr:hypothetical protein [Tannerella sp.]
MTTSETHDTAVFVTVEDNASPFSDEPGYHALVRQCGLKEMQDGTDCFLIPAEGRNWMLNLEETAATMNRLQEQDSQDAGRILEMLAFIIEQLDRSRPAPQYVISYMCRDIVVRAALQRFNDTTGSTCNSLTDLSDMIGDNVAEANETFDSLRFCDPAMGTGRFLVTLMHEIIAVKSQLGILADRNGDPLYSYKIVADGNELLTFDKKHFRPFLFDPANPESRRIRETFLHEKSICIEHCLYGVDIDSVAVTTARLRLWYELLKHTCRQGKLQFAATYVANNLRCGDALVSRLAIHDDLRALFKRIGHGVGDYIKLARDLSRAKTDGERNSAAGILELIKTKIRREITADEKHGEDLRKWQRELDRLKSPGLFEPDEETEKLLAAKLQEAQTMIDKYRLKMMQKQNSLIYDRAVEWRYDFPELLSGTGEFAGFDAVVGNPPDTQKEILAQKHIYRQMNYKMFKQTGEVSSLFCELGNRILRRGYFLSYITSSSWMRSVSAGKMRQFLTEETNPLLMLDFEASGGIVKSLDGKGILILQKAHNQYRMAACRVNERFNPQQMRLEDYVARHAEASHIGTGPAGDTSTFGLLSEMEKSINNKIEQLGMPLRMWDIHLHEGIITGCDEAFVIDEKTKDGFVRADYKNTDIIRPLLPGENVRRYTPEKSNLWLICIPWHFPLLYDKSITHASARAEERFVQQYPVIYEHLQQYREKLLARDAPELGVTFEWYALQHIAMENEWDDFAQQKIVWRQETSAPDFSFDYGGCAVLEPACFIIGQHLKYLLGVLNSRLGQYMLRNSPRISDGNIQLSVLEMEALRVPAPGAKIESDMISLVNKRTSDTNPAECEALDRRIDRIVYGIYGLTQDEINFMEKEVDTLLTQ